MICKKCGYNSELWEHYSGLTKEHIRCYQNRNENTPTLLTTIYKNHKRFYFCKKCNEPFDYKDMPMDVFFDWLKCSSEAGDSHKVSGKALIRYFELDKLLEAKENTSE